MAPLGVGLIGTGTAAEYHARAISLTDGLQLVSVCSRSKERAKEFALRHGVDRVFDEIEYLLSDNTADLLVVASETGLHLPAVMAALSQGLPVVVESPLEVNYDRAKAMMDKVEEEGAFLFPVNPLLSMPSFLSLQKALASGKLGEIKRVSLSMENYRSPSYSSVRPWRSNRKLSGGGILMQEGVLGLECLLTLFGEVSSMEGEVTERDSLGFDSAAELRMQFVSGGKGVFHMTQNRVGKGFHLVVEGSEGTMEAEGGEGKHFLPYQYLKDVYDSYLEDLEKGIGVEKRCSISLEALALLKRFLDE